MQDAFEARGVKGITQVYLFHRGGWLEQKDTPALVTFNAAAKARDALNIIHGVQMREITGEKVIVVRYALPPKQPAGNPPAAC